MIIIIFSFFLPALELFLFLEEIRWRESLRKSQRRLSFLSSFFHIHSLESEMKNKQTNKSRNKERKNRWFFKAWTPISIKLVSGMINKIALKNELKAKHENEKKISWKTSSIVSTPRFHFSSLLFTRSAEGWRTKTRSNAKYLTQQKKGNK